MLAIVIVTTNTGRPTDTGVVAFNIFFIALCAGIVIANLMSRLHPYVAAGPDGIEGRSAIRARVLVPWSEVDLVRWDHRLGMGASTPEREISVRRRGAAGTRDDRRVCTSSAASSTVPSRARTWRRGSSRHAAATVQPHSSPGWTRRATPRVERTSVTGTETILETERLRLRPLDPSDADALAAVLSDATTMHWYPHPFSREEVEAWIARNRAHWDERRLGLWGLELNGDRRADRRLRSGPPDRRGRRRDRARLACPARPVGAGPRARGRRRLPQPLLGRTRHHAPDLPRPSREHAVRPGRGEDRHDGGVRDAVGEPPALRLLARHPAAVTMRHRTVATTVTGGLLLLTLSTACAGGVEQQGAPSSSPSRLPDDVREVVVERAVAFAEENGGTVPPIASVASTTRESAAGRLVLAGQRGHREPGRGLAHPTRVPGLAAGPIR